MPPLPSSATAGAAVGRLLGVPARRLSPATRFTARVRRLAAVSAVALGVVWGLWLATVDSSPAAGWLLAGGWVLMPVALATGVRRPRLLYLTAIPSSVEAAGLLAICIYWSPGGLAGAGWLVLAAGIVLGAAMGAWLWLRWLPVPAAMLDPHAPARLALMALHVVLVLSGMALVAVAALH